MPLILNHQERSNFTDRIAEQYFGRDFKLFHFMIPEKSRQGLLGCTSAITPDLVCSAYLQGVFPWYSEADGEKPRWWSPDPRFVLFPENLHIPASLAKFMKHSPFTYTFDKDFAAVINGCARVERKGQGGTWIGPEMMDVYCTLAERGIAHSVEVWHNGILAGGFYGVLIGSVFFGESMFTVESGASKSAFVLFARAFEKSGGCLIDSQVYTENLARFGAVNISRSAFLRYEREYLPQPLSEDPAAVFLQYADALSDKNFADSLLLRNL